MNSTARRIVIVLLCVASAAAHVRAAEPWRVVGDANLKDWRGIALAPDGVAQLAVPGEASYRFPDGPRGFYNHGFRTENDGTVDLKQYAGVRFGVRLPDDQPVTLAISIRTIRFGSQAEKTITTPVTAAGRGWHTVYLPWSAMPFDQAGPAFLRFGKGVTIAATGSGAAVGLRDVRFVKAARVVLECDIRGKLATQNGQAVYVVNVSNTTSVPQAVALSFATYGWQTMVASVEPATLQLSPGETKPCRVTVAVGDRVPPGGHETQVLQAIANGDADKASRVTLVTTRSLPHPYVMHTEERWQAIVDRVTKYDWAKTAAAAYVARADKWTVPEVAKAPRNDPNDNSGPFVFPTTSENDLLAAAYAYKLTGDSKYAEKVALYLRRLSDPQIGYPVTLRGCNQSLVQEGHFFQHAAMAYDMIYDTLSDADHAQIDAALRLLIETLDRANENGSINNWNLSEVVGAFYCALAMQDLELAERFFSGPGGVRDQLAKGTMDDGWWYECSISYNMWCASEFTQVALAYEPFGVNFRTAWVPANYSPSAMLTAELSGGNSIFSPDANMKGKPFGMDPGLYGPTVRPYRQITDLWNSLLPFIDYRGVMFGVNDSTEAQVTGNRAEVGGQPFEIAYFAYRDPRYAALIKLGGGKRDLLYAVPDLPEITPELYRDNAYADNVGLVMLRSQTPDRPIDQQIQAALHYGTHGWAHGHFDRTDLLSLMRYGRSFWNPESVFYVYEPFMYKFYTQTSVNHNMVVVDQKMQEATPGKRLMFSTGKAMQVTAVEATARWSNPPYGGMVYDYVPVKTFEEKTWREGRFVPIPATQPAYGTLTDFTEPILQRRVMVVTDDYVLLADFVKGRQPHTFDNLIQLKGFQGLDGPDKKHLRHDAQWNADPLGSAQFVTDADWYSVKAPSVARFIERWGPGADEAGSRSNGNVPGVLKLDVHTLWPPQQEIMVATAPEQHNVEKRLFWNVRGDGRTLAEGKFGAWILGRGDIDVSVDGVKNLELETKTEISRRPTVFWAGVRIVKRDGTEIPLSQLPVKTDNVVAAKGPDQDYAGGPVKIAGDSYTNTLAAEPKDAARPGLIRIDLSGLNAVRLKAVVGSDYPVGDESQRRKVFSLRTSGTETQSLTLIEPYESQPVVKSATATAADTLRVELSDGRVQEVVLRGLTGDGRDLAVSLTETRDGKPLRYETTDR